MPLPLIGIGAAALVAIRGMLVKWFFEILTALGVSFVSYQFSSAVIEKLMNHIHSSYISLDSDLIALLGLVGVPEAFNIIFGAFNFCVGIFTTGKALKFFGASK